MTGNVCDLLEFQLLHVHLCMYSELVTNCGFVFTRDQGPEDTACTMIESCNVGVRPNQNILYKCMTKAMIYTIFLMAD